MFARLFAARDRSPSVPQHIYGALVTQARHPHFFTAMQMPDTPTGRFEMLCLHMFLLSHRLSGEADERALPLSQEVFDIFATELDRALREMGIGDTSIPKRKKRMITAFYAQIDQLADLLDAGDCAGLAQKLLARAPDAPGDESAAMALGGYLVAARGLLAEQGFEEIIGNGPNLPAPDGAA